MQLSIGISPCPNDTFIFDKMLNEAADNIQWQLHLEDVETLNEWALAGKLDITKLSFATYLQVQDHYDLLQVGSALGKGVGPILVTKEALSFESHETLQDWLQDKKIAIPGKFTTANLLLSQAFPMVHNKAEMVFHGIENLVLTDQVDAGLLIHESRFTYEAKGLHKLIDLGEWWEKTYQCPIPLGGICIKKSLADTWKAPIEKMIQESLQYSWDNFPALSEFVKNNAQEMEEAVMRQHIELYVNEETMQLSTAGQAGIQQLALVNM